MSDGEGPDSVEAVKIDIETTRAELVETVNELSDRLDPKKRVEAVTQGVTESTKQVVGQAQELSMDTATKAQDVARAGVIRGRQLADGRERQMVGAVALGVGLLFAWHLWRNRS